MGNCTDRLGRSQTTARTHLHRVKRRRTKRPLQSQNTPTIINERTDYSRDLCTKSRWVWLLRHVPKRPLPDIISHVRQLQSPSFHAAGLQAGAVQEEEGRREVESSPQTAGQRPESAEDTKGTDYRIRLRLVSVFTMVSYNTCQLGWRCYCPPHGAAVPVQADSQSFYSAPPATNNLAAS